jgi:hypothetical protein
MSTLLDRAVAAIRELPEAGQEAIAREILERIEADARWDALFADPRSETLLERLADEAHEEVRRGEVYDGDPSDRNPPEISSDAQLLASLRQATG